MVELARALAALAPRLGPVAGAPVALDGGITNRNFRVRFGGCDYVVRLHGKDTALLGINRESERLAGEAAAALGFGPRVAAVHDDSMVTEYLDATPIDADALRRAPDAVARALRAFHDSGVRLPVRFWVPDLLDEYAAIVRARGGELPDAYAPAQALARRIATALPLSAPAPCHDDLLPGNLLATGERAMLVDWEYAGMGHRIFDLGNLSVNNEFDAAADERLLAAYFGAPPTARRRAALALMRIMSDAREAAWGVVQGVLSELEFDFADYARRHFDRLATAAADPRLAEWLDAAAA